MSKRMNPELTRFLRDAPPAPKIFLKVEETLRGWFARVNFTTLDELRDDLAMVAGYGPTRFAAIASATARIRELGYDGDILT